VAKNLNDRKLLAKLGGGDVVALEFKYHPKWLAYNRERSHAQKQWEKEDLTKHEAYPTAFSELVPYTNETKLASPDPLIFHLTDLFSLYKERLHIASQFLV